MPGTTPRTGQQHQPEKPARSARAQAREPGVPRYRFRLRFSLRALFVALLAFAVWLAFLAAEARRERKLVSLIRAYGGSVQFDFEVQWDEEYHSYRSPADPSTLALPGPKIVRDWLGVEYLAD